MPGLPEVTVVGTLTADPDLRYTATGVAVANFTVAANDRRFDKARNEWVDGDATFLRCSIWRDAAEHVAESLNRGNRVLVTGQLKQRSYETNEGEKRTVFELEVTEIGPSLKWATAKVAKAARANGTGTGTGKSQDQWSAAPAEDKPPF